MTFFQVHTGGDLEDERRCFLGNAVKGIEGDAERFGLTELRVGG